MKKILVLISSTILFNGAFAQNVGIGVANPTAKLDVAGTLRIADGTEASGKILTSDGTGLASWNSRVKPTVIRVVDANTGCSVIHTPIYNSSFTLADSAYFTVTGKTIRFGTGRHDINLTVDGTIVQIVLTYTPPGDGSQWAEAFFTYAGKLLAGSHTIQVVPADNQVAWGCGNLYGNMIITIFN